MPVGTEIGEPGESASDSEVNAMGASTTGTILGGETLKNAKLFQWSVREQNSVAHLVGSLELGSIWIEDGKGACDK